MDGVLGRSISEVITNPLTVCVRASGPHTPIILSIFMVSGWLKIIFYSKISIGNN